MPHRTALPNPIDDLAAVDELAAARYLGVSPRTLQAWRLIGSGPAYCKFGRSVRYRLRDLAAYMEAHRVTSTSEADGARP